MALKTKKFIPRIIILQIVFNEFHHLSCPLLPAYLLLPLSFYVTVSTNLDPMQGHDVQNTPPHMEVQIRNLFHIVLISKLSYTRQWTLMAIIRAGSPMGFQPKNVKNSFFWYIFLPKQLTSLPILILSERKLHSAQVSAQEFIAKQKNAPCDLWGNRKGKTPSSIPTRQQLLCSSVPFLLNCFP